MNTNTPINLPAEPAPPLSSQLMNGEVLLEWSAPIHPVHERTARWYLIGGIMVVCVAAYAVLTGAWTVAFVSLLVGGLYYLVRKEPPVIRMITIYASGFTFNGEFTHWTDCDGFWILHTPAYAELHIVKKKKKREVVIQTGYIDPTVLRANLSQFIECKSDRRETLLDLFIRLCKL